MRRVEWHNGFFLCWTYEEDQWTLRQQVTTKTDAVAFWLADPWLPNEQSPLRPRGWGAVSRASAIAEAWPDRRWDEVIQAMEFYVVTETGARPHQLGPDSEWTSGRVYVRLCSYGAAAQIYWRDGRSRLDDLRAECPVRTDLPGPLRCVVLAEATILLLRRPHMQGYIHIDQAPANLAEDAAAVLRKFDVPPPTFDLLTR
jgi:hypothetical protein